MQGIQRRRRNREEKPRSPLIYNRLTLLALVMFSIVLVASAIDLARKEHDTRQTKERKEEEFALTERRKKALTSSLQRIESPRGTEAALRASFPVARPGEEIVVLLDPKEVPVEEKPKTFWGSILEFFNSASTRN